MLPLILFFAYMCGVTLVLGLLPLQVEKRPTLEAMGFSDSTKKKQRRLALIFRRIAKINKPLCTPALRLRISRELAIGQVNLSVEEFILLKEIFFIGGLAVLYPFITPDVILGWLSIAFVFGYLGPEFWLKHRIRKIKSFMVRELPDAIDLLGLCVNAGLDFMLSLKWVVEKSRPTVMINELNTLLQEINVGKTRREAIKDLADRYQLTDLSTFSRTLIQADKMGTSVSEAFNILSEDMRIARFRRGEQIALKAPLKMLVPLLLFIFPVVGLLVAGPILLDFMENNPFKGLG